MRALFLFFLILMAGFALPAFAQEKMLGPAAEQPVVETGEQPGADVPNLLEQLESAGQPKALPPPDNPLPGPGQKKPLPYKSYDEIPEEAIEEALQVSEECKVNRDRSTYYDCDCVGMRFLEQRLVRGPDVSQTVVMLGIQSECPNTPAIAGSIYQTCIGRGISYFPARHDPEQFCECVGNTYAKLYEQSGRVADMRLMIRLETVSAISCTNQEPGVPPLIPQIK